MAAGPDKEALRYCVITLLYMGARPPYQEVEKTVQDAHIHSLFINMRNIAHDIKVKSLARIMHARGIRSIGDMSDYDLGLVIKDISKTLISRPVLLEQFKALRERIAVCFGIDADIAYTLGIEKTEKGTMVTFVFCLDFAGGFDPYESRQTFFTKLTDYFSHFTPPAHFLDEHPPQ